MRHHRQHRRARGAAESSFELFESALTGKSGHQSENGKAAHKALQLCRQVERAIGMALAGECNDDVLRELSVESVEPAGSAAQLIVRLRLPRTVALPDVLERIDRHSATLRCIVAAAICRKRVPTLNYICLPTPSTEGGGHD